MVTDMDVDKDVLSSQLEDNKQECPLPEAVEIENKELLNSEELGCLKDSVEPVDNVSNVNDVEMIAEDSAVKDGCADIPAEDSAVQDGCADIPAEVSVFKDGCEDILAEDSVVEDGCSDIPVEDSVVQDGCVDTSSAAGNAIPTVDSNIEASGEHACGRTGEDDKKCPDLENQVMSVVASNDSFLDVKGKDGKTEELTNGMEMSNEALVLGSGEENGSKEEDLNNGETQRDFTMNDGTKKDTSSEEELNNVETQRDSTMNDGTKKDTSSEEELNNVETQRDSTMNDGTKKDTSTEEELNNVETQRDSTMNDGTKKDTSTEEELDNVETQRDSAMNDGTKKDTSTEEELNNVETQRDSTMNDGTKKDTSTEEELSNGETPRDSSMNDGTKKDTPADKVSGLDVLQENGTKQEELSNKVTAMDMAVDNELQGEVQNPELDMRQEVCLKTSNNSFLGPDPVLGDETGTEEERAEFMKEIETFHKEKFLEFKPPRFYGEPLNCLKLWRSVVKLGGYEQVTSCKLWRQVGESFNPPKTCTTVSWTFRCFYEKTLLEYEKHKMRCGDLPFTDASFPEPCSAGDQAGHNQAAGPGRARRDSAARAMQGWHSQRSVSNGEVGDEIIKDKSSSPVPKREKQLKSIGLLKRKTPPPMDLPVNIADMKTSRQQLDTMVVDIGTPADWVKINVQKTKDCYEIYALVPGLLREEVRVQSDPAGHLIISGDPENIDNPWGVIPFKKVVSLPSRIDPQQTSALVTLHGQLFVRVPFEQSSE